MSDTPVTTTTTTDMPATSTEPSLESTQADAREAEYRQKLAAARGEDLGPKTDAPKSEPKKPVETEGSDSDVESGKNDTPEVSFKLKVNGEEIEIKDRAEITRLAQLGMASNKKFEEAAKLRKEAEGFIHALRTNPLSVLEHPNLGINFRELAEEYLYNQLQQEAMPPEQRELASAKAELEKYRRQEAEKQEQERQAQAERLQEQYRQDYSRKFQEALEGGGLPKTEWTIARMAGYMRQAIDRGLELEPKDVIHLVKQDFIKAQQDFYSQMTPDKMVEVLGKDTVDKIRQHQVSQYKQGQQPVKTGATPPASSNKQTFSSVEEMREALTRR